MNQQIKNHRVGQTQNNNVVKSYSLIITLLIVFSIVSLFVETYSYIKVPSDGGIIKLIIGMVIFLLLMFLIMQSN